jgi:hypothetical protein
MKPAAPITSHVRGLARGQAHSVSISMAEVVMAVESTSSARLQVVRRAAGRPSGPSRVSPRYFA